MTKAVTAELQCPDGMVVSLRTSSHVLVRIAGQANRLSQADYEIRAEPG